ncbi:DUF695 domain-containing protein [Dietzia sp.]|uniref:DUF695 domain-containing protein n=1 Tax=Dietzia sp. TaxID=1871616 RepID=UPI002FDA1197
MDQPKRDAPGAWAATSRADAPVDLDGGASGTPKKIADFWAWWCSGGGQRIAKFLGRGKRRDVDSALNSLIAGIDPRLSWRVDPTLAGLHRLTVTAQGHPEARCVARRWLLAAPENDPNWRFADLLGPRDERTISFEGVDVELEDTWVSLFGFGTAFRAAVSHPLMAGFEPADRPRLARALLEAACGEAAVEHWIAQVTVTEVVSEDAVQLHEVAVALVELSIENMSAELEPSWRVLQGRLDGKQMVAMARVPLVPLVRPECDRHVQLDVPYSDDSAGGYPGPDSLPQLQDFEDSLAELVSANGECVASETVPGMRRLHFYTDSLSPAAAALVDAAHGWGQGEVSVSTELDPTWQDVAHLRA